MIETRGKLTEKVKNKHNFVPAEFPKQTNVTMLFWLDSLPIHIHFMPHLPLTFST